MKSMLLKLAAIAVCVMLLCGALCGCNKTPDTTDTTPTTVADATTTDPVVTLPTYVREDATGSALIGTWTVDSHGGTVTGLEFRKDGSVVVTMGDAQIGGGFVEDGAQVTLNVAGAPKVFTATFTGDVVTLENDTETWTLTKVA